MFIYFSTHKKCVTRENMDRFFDMGAVLACHWVNRLYNSCTSFSGRVSPSHRKDQECDDAQRVFLVIFSS